MADVYTPMEFFKGNKVQVAETWSEHYQLLWEGWTLNGPAPDPPRSTVVAMLDDVDAAVDGLVATPEGIADGQLLRWDQASGLYLAVEPTGESEIASAENATGVVTTLSTSGGSSVVTDIPNCSIIVPASSRPVYITYGASIQLTTLGVGVFIAALYEGATPLDVAPKPLPASVSVGPNFTSTERTFRLGPTVAQRTFKLRGYIWTNAGDDAAANVQNSATSRSYIRACTK